MTDEELTQHLGGYTLADTERHIAYNVALRLRGGSADYFDDWLRFLELKRKEEQERGE